MAYHEIKGTEWRHGYKIRVLLTLSSDQWSKTTCKSHALQVPKVCASPSRTTVEPQAALNIMYDPALDVG